MVLDVRGFNLTPNLSGLNNSIGALIQQSISDNLAQKAQGGDEMAMSRLASQDPNRYMALGSMAKDKTKEAADAQERQNQMLGHIARGYGTANDKKSYLAATVEKLRQSGYEDLANLAAQDLSEYDSNPAAIDEEYGAAAQMFAPESSGSDSVFAPKEIFGGRLWHIADRKGRMQVAYPDGTPVPPEKVQEEWNKAEAAFLEFERNKNYNRSGGTNQANLEYKPKIESAVTLANATAEHMAKGISAETAAHIEYAKASAADRAKIVNDLERGMPAKRAVLETLKYQTERDRARIEKASGLSNWGTTGFIGRVMSMGPTDATRLRDIVTELKGSGLISTLNAMKAQSPSGSSGMGALAIAEMEALIASVGSLNPDGSPEYLKESLANIAMHYQKAQELSQQALKADEAFLQNWKEDAKEREQKAEKDFKSGTMSADEMSLDDIRNLY